jgi:hypothetical protein
LDAMVEADMKDLLKWKFASFLKIMAILQIYLC